MANDKSAILQGEGRITRIIMSIYETMRQEAEMENVTLRQLEAFLAVAQEAAFRAVQARRLRCRRRG